MVVRRLLYEESGQDLIEYALVAGLIGLGAVASMRTLGNGVGSAFSTVNSRLNSSI
jgi:pilus assembly protein Flp/PilA